MSAKAEEREREIIDGPNLPIARVAHEVVRNVSVSFGDYSTPPWESLDADEKKRIYQLVSAYLSTPLIRPDMVRLAISDQCTRAKDYALYGAVRGIALEQMRT